MIFITGDCHGNYKRFKTKNFPIQKELTKSDVVIICGDFGLWHKDAKEDYWLNWLNDKPFTAVFVDGNHENFDRLYSSEFEGVDFYGAKAHRIRDSIFHVKRGEIFEKDGLSFFCFGGAASHDIQDGILEPHEKDRISKWSKDPTKMFRVNHLSWWEQEMPSVQEMENGIKKLKERNYEVDYIISHCAPQHVVSAFSQGWYRADSLTCYFNEIDYQTNYKKWYCGHYHDEFVWQGKYNFLYESIIRID